MQPPHFLLLSPAERAELNIMLDAAETGDMGPINHLPRYASQGTVLQQLADTEAAATVASTASMLPPVNTGPRIPRRSHQQDTASAMDQLDTAHAVGHAEGAQAGYELAQRGEYRAGFWWGLICGHLNSAVFGALCVVVYSWLLGRGA